jgi:ABC-type glycerol-3-phosphate transport system substrate-binding protein
VEGYSNSKQFNLNNKQRKMKKVIAIFAIATTLVACGGKGTTEGTTDSTSVVLDSTAVTATDSTVAEIKADSVIAK